MVNVYGRYIRLNICVFSAVALLYAYFIEYIWLSIGTTATTLA